MKNMLALGGICVCALLLGCDSGSSVQPIDSSQITTPPEEKQPPPGGATKFKQAAGGANVGAGAAGGPAPKPGN